MRRKPALLYLSESHIVYREVEHHFTEKAVKLPPEWKALVTLACFPRMSVEQDVCLGFEHVKNEKGKWVLKRDAKTGKPVGLFSKVDMLAPERRSREQCFARDPDTTLKIEQFARERLARLKRNDKKTTKAAEAREFFLKHFQHPVLVRDQSKLRLPRSEDAKSKKRIEFVRVNSNDATDAEFAAFLFGGKGPNSDIEIVKAARQSCSEKIKKLSLSPKELARKRREIRRELKVAGMPPELADDFLKEAQTVVLSPKGVIWPP